MMPAVYLIGAGPGNTYLITVRGQNLLKQADVIIYDYLANDILLDLTSPGAEKIYVGKHCGKHTMDQDAINALMYAKAREGKRVVRLKGGDPFVFGRGGEEAAFLRSRGIPYEIVPGVTSASAALAYAGIPLTHRSFASTATIVTGHEDPLKENSGINWSALAQMSGTLVIFMGVKRLPGIVGRLVERGKPENTPAAVIRLGTTPRQQTVTGTLENIAERVNDAQLGPPALIVVGEVVRLREQLQWYESLPLFGKSILITRSAHQAAFLSEQLSLLGAEVIHRPTIEIRPPGSFAELDACLQRGNEYNWVLFTSVNGVRAFSQRMKELGVDIRLFHAAKFAGIGAATRKALGELGIRVDFVPEKFSAEGFIREFQEQYTDFSGMKVLFPAANIARDVIPDKLRELGAEVFHVTAYETAAPEHSSRDLRDVFNRHGVNLATFTSSSTVENFFALFPEQERQNITETLQAASIGPMTSRTLREHGVEPVIEADVHTIPGLIDAILKYYARRQEDSAAQA